MTNSTNPINGHILTLALANSSHPRIVREVAKGNTNRARAALRGRILATLEQANDDDERIDMDRVIRASADTLNETPGPFLMGRIDQVIETLIPISD